MQCSGYSFTVYVLVFKPSHYAESTRMFTTRHFMPFTGHVFIEKLMIGTSFNNPTTANSLIAPE